eukprot:CAMPEP_0118923694 /NCGR_PEP_ID=MMETSP1169-20130426/2123_1 /TAXON_ID=36882 /ORGANISM="Pyramimonas obovata, Strain CCMP722" /LENGTH=263 /DNA_ID=CAMNT_0006864713 /DNA_START=48 /DNA_END=839 /DNA_ORIENTATION=+
MASFGLVSAPISLHHVTSRARGFNSRRIRVPSKVSHCVCRADAPREGQTKSEVQNSDISLSRRGSMAMAVGLAFASRDAGFAVAADEGFTTYERGNRTRFETSISSALRPYTLDVPDYWKEEVVSLNDGKLYGVDLRYSGSSEGQLAVSVLPYANRDSITQAGSPEEALDTFIELVGAFWNENGFGDAGRAVGAEASVVTGKDDQKYYVYELQSPKSLIAAVATDGQLYILNVSTSARQWKKSEATLKKILASFNVPPPPPLP